MWSTFSSYVCGQSNSLPTAYDPKYNNTLDLLITIIPKRSPVSASPPASWQILKILENEFSNYWHGFAKLQRNSTYSYTIVFQFSISSERLAFIKRLGIDIYDSFDIGDVNYEYKICYNSSTTTASTTNTTRTTSTTTSTTADFRSNSVTLSPSLPPPHRHPSTIRENCLKVVSLNCNRPFNTMWLQRGKHIIEAIRNYDIICLQDCANMKQHEKEIKNMFSNDIKFYWNEDDYNPRAHTVIIVNDSRITGCLNIPFERSQKLYFVLNGAEYELWNVYAPNWNDDKFWRESFREHFLSENRTEKVIVVGDWNAVENEIDRCVNKLHSYDKAMIPLWKDFKQQNFADIWFQRNVVHKAVNPIFSYRHGNEWKSRLDRYYISSELSDKVIDIKYIETQYSDHKMVVAFILIEDDLLGSNSHRPSNPSHVRTINTLPSTSRTAAQNTNDGYYSDIARIHRLSNNNDDHQDALKNVVGNPVGCITGPIIGTRLVYMGPKGGLFAFTSGGAKYYIKRDKVVFFKNS